MNKEVIYLEPEDDITDILTKLQQADQKLVALVPPKKATMLRSAVNMKLVARVAKECEKVVVVVTADPAIIKMAMGAKIPVAKTLQSRPVVPTEENLKRAEAAEDVIDEDSLAENGNSKDQKHAKFASTASNSPEKAANGKSGVPLDLDEESLENDQKRADQAKSKKKAAQEAANANNFFTKYRKWIIVGCGALLVLIVALVWAFVFAPAVSITVAISSTPNNFSENIRFTTDENAQNLDENLLYVEKLTLDKTYKTDIAATDTEDRGEKATGRLTVSVNFVPYEVVGEGFTLSVPEGTRFVNNVNELTYVAVEGKSKSWDGDEPTIPCDNGAISSAGSASALRRTCTFSVVVDVEAASGGEEYNVSSSSSWAPLASSGNASVANGSPISGGTTDIVDVIGEDDINKVKEAQLAEHTLEGREDLFSDIGKDMVAIEASFGNEVTEVKTTPERGEEVKPDDKPTAEVKIQYYVYAIKMSTVEEFVKSKTTIPGDQKIYSYGEPYFERFTNIENEARLKTTYETGPTVTDEDILNRVKGMKTGQVQSILRSITGVSSVDISTSYPWVWTVPDDDSKVTVKLILEDKE